jgi:hypothetical protein
VTDPSLVEARQLAEKVLRQDWTLHASTPKLARALLSALDALGRKEEREKAESGGTAELSPVVKTLRKLLAKATPGEWTATDRGQSIEIASIEFHVAQIDMSYDADFDREQCEADAALIVTAINALPSLLAALSSSDSGHEQEQDGGGAAACSETAETRPSSAGDCQVCGEFAKKRYGGEGRYFVMCLDCWLSEVIDPQDTGENVARRKGDKT